MKSRNSSRPSSSRPKPEDQLQIISMTEDILERLSPEKKKAAIWEIEPWQNQQESPSHSPERRIFKSRPNPILKQSPFLRNPAKSQPKKILQNNNNCNFSIKLKGNKLKPSFLDLQPVECENQRPSTVGTKFGRLRKQSLKEEVMSNQNYFQDKQYSSYRQPVNMIVYPVIHEGKRKRVFKKMEKFHNFVSVSLRK